MQSLADVDAGPPAAADGVLAPAAGRVGHRADSSQRRQAGARRRRDDASATFLRDLYTHRRKNLRGALTGWPSGRREKSEVDAKLAELGFDGNLRAEDLDLEDHRTLCRRVWVSLSEISLHFPLPTRYAWGTPHSRATHGFRHRFALVLLALREGLADPDRLADVGLSWSPADGPFPDHLAARGVLTREQIDRLARRAGETPFDVTGAKAETPTIAHDPHGTSSFAGLLEGAAGTGAFSLDRNTPAALTADSDDDADWELSRLTRPGAAINGSVCIGPGGSAKSGWPGTPWSAAMWP